MRPEDRSSCHNISPVLTLRAILFLHWSSWQNLLGCAGSPGTGCTGDSTVGDRGSVAVKDYPHTTVLTLGIELHTFFLSFCLTFFLSLKFTLIQILHFCYTSFFWMSKIFHNSDKYFFMVKEIFLFILVTNDKDFTEIRDDFEPWSLHQEPHLWEANISRNLSHYHSRCVTRDLDSTRAASVNGLSDAPPTDLWRTNIFYARVQHTVKFWK